MNGPIEDFVPDLTTEPLLKEVDAPGPVSGETGVSTPMGHTSSEIISEPSVEVRPTEPSLSSQEYPPLH